MKWLVAALLVLVVVLAVIAWRARTRIGRNNLARLRVAQRAETEAERLLERAGYAILDRQVTAEWEMRVDGELCAVRCRADLVVGRGDRTWVAEVKSQERAADPTHPATRRQLLEYLRAFDVDGVLLVDMVERRIRAVAFD